MYRGTTPTFTFKLPIDVSTITKTAISFRQPGGCNIEKSLADCAKGEGNKLTCSLTEEETLGLRAATLYPMEIQMRVGVGSARFASQIWQVPIDRILKDGAL